MAPAAALRALLNTFKPMAARTSFAAEKSSSRLLRTDVKCSPRHQAHL
jgi:hypothetical protein